MYFSSLCFDSTAIVGQLTATNSEWAVITNLQRGEYHSSLFIPFTAAYNLCIIHEYVRSTNGPRRGSTLVETQTAFIRISSLGEA